MEIDVLKQFMFILCIIITLGTVFLMASAFIDFNVEVKTQDMERLNVELSENILTSDMVVDKSLFNAEKLFDYQNQEKTLTTTNPLFNIQPNPRICGYGYSIAVKGLEEKVCGSKSDCVDFCTNLCGGNPDEYDCSRPFLGIIGAKKCYCTCQSGGEYDTYEYMFGYKAGDTKIKEVTRTYPVGLYEDTQAGPQRSTVSAATMTLTLYDSWLTRIACMAEKAYNLKEIQRMNVFDLSKFIFKCPYERSFNCVPIKKFHEKELCIYDLDTSGNTWDYEIKECINSEVPVATFFDGYLNEIFNINKNVTLVAYPIRSDAPINLLAMESPSKHPNDMERYSRNNCEWLSSEYDYVAKSGDNVGIVLFCLETEKDGEYP